MVGQLIGNYKILEKLSEGGMGAVYKAVDTVLHREVAIKVLRPQLASKTTVVERFRLEAIALAKLNHPNIATLHSFFDHGNEFYMILEFVRGETLDKVLQRRGSLPFEEAIPLFSQVLDGIAHAHEFGIIHRDLKPANMMLTERGTLKVLDFGIARLLGSARITRVGNIIGTLEYMSPEQVKGQETDARSDIYALGMTLYEILTGKTPFDSENEFELIQKQIGEMPESPRSINPEIPEEIEAAIIKAYAKNPDERFQTASEFNEILLNIGFAASVATQGVAVSLPVKFSARPSHSDISQTSIPKEVFQETAGNVAEEQSEEIEIETREVEIGRLLNTSAASSLDFADDIKEILPNNKPSPAETTSEALNEAQNQPSLLSKLTRLSYASVGASIIVLLILLATPLILFEGEKLSPTPENGQNLDVKQSLEIKPQSDRQKSDAVTTPDAQPAPTAAPAQTSPKKKPPRESDAERLRRTEKILTGN